MAGSSATASFTTRACSRPGSSGACGQGGCRRSRLQPHYCAGMEHGAPTVAVGAPSGSPRGEANAMPSCATTNHKPQGAGTWGVHPAAHHLGPRMPEQLHNQLPHQRARPVLQPRLQQALHRLRGGSSAAGRGACCGHGADCRQGQAAPGVRYTRASKQRAWQGSRRHKPSLPAALPPAGRARRGRASSVPPRLPPAACVGGLAGRVSPQHDAMQSCCPGSIGRGAMNAREASQPAPTRHTAAPAAACAGRRWRCAALRCRRDAAAAARKGGIAREGGGRWQR